MDIRDRLRKEHEAALAELEALRNEKDPRRALHRLDKFRQAWVVHALSEETVIYRALESAESRDPAERTDERFIEHELVEGLLDKLSRNRPGTLEWAARLKVARDIIARHIEEEYHTVFPRLGRMEPGELEEMAERFEAVLERLTMLEEAKAA